MTLTIWAAVGLVLLGAAIGVISGMVGIGGGVLVIPALMLLLGFTQQQANGTSMAMLLPPIGVLAVVSYWRGGNINVPVAVLLACGFVFGAYFGAELVNRQKVHETTLRVLFAVLLLYIAGRILFRPGGRARAALETSLLIAGFVLTYVVMRLLGRRWKAAPNWADVYRSKQTLPLNEDREA